MQCHEDDSETPILRLIHILLYVDDAGNNTFRMLPDMPTGTPVKIHNAKLALHSIAEGQHVLCCDQQHSNSDRATACCMIMRLRRHLQQSGASCIKRSGHVHIRLHIVLLVKVAATCCFAQQFPGKQLLPEIK